jgi:hypothetical protein
MVCLEAAWCLPANRRHLTGGEIATARPKPGGANGYRLAAEAESTDDVPVALDVVVSDIVEKSPATADELQETPSGVMVTFVHLEMLGEVDDALAQNGDLDFVGSGVRLVETVFGDGGLLVWHGGNRPLMFFGMADGHNTPALQW